MLSIGKLGTGHHGYYERSVASGAEDYYTGRGEAWGTYLGRGAEALDLKGLVEQGHLKHLFGGTHPASGEHWIKRREPDRKPRAIRMPDGRVVEGKPPDSDRGVRPHVLSAQERERAVRSLRGTRPQRHP